MAFTYVDRLAVCATALSVLLLAAVTWGTAVAAAVEATPTPIQRAKASSGPVYAWPLPVSIAEINLEAPLRFAPRKAFAS
jgi:hypothetical protein